MFGKIKCYEDAPLPLYHHNLTMADSDSESKYSDPNFTLISKIKRETPISPKAAVIQDTDRDIVSRGVWSPPNPCLGK